MSTNLENEEFKQEEEKGKILPDFDMFKLFDDPKTLTELIDKVYQHLTAKTLNITRRLMRREKLNADEIYEQQELQKQLKILTKTYDDMKKAGRIMPTEVAVAESNDVNFLDKIKKMESSMGNIVREIPNTPTK